jgi:YHS domain-containing protein
MRRDPVCGTILEASQVRDSREFEGTTYYFCCADCEGQFEADPHKFAAPEQPRVPCCGFGMVRPTVQRGTTRSVN